MHLFDNRDDQNQNSTIDSNISFLELPFFDMPFRKRVKKCWDNFLVEEGKLRELIDSKADVNEIAITRIKDIHLRMEQIDLEVNLSFLSVL